MNIIKEQAAEKKQRQDINTHTHTLALLPKGEKAGILLWGFGGEVRGDGQGGDGRCSRSN